MDGAAPGRRVAQQAPSMGWLETGTDALAEICDMRFTRMAVRF
jgi:hypothetical protein